MANGMLDEIAPESFVSKLLKGEGRMRLVRAALFAGLIGGALFFGWSFKRVTDLSRVEPLSVPPLPRQSQEDARRLDELLESYRSSMEARRGSRGVVVALTDRDRRPFAASARRTAPGTASVVASLPTETFETEALPPVMFVRAIMVAGKDAIAIMDIAGLGNGIIVKTGFSFSEGKGRIVKIAPEKVTVRWGGRNMDITPGF